MAARWMALSAARQARQGGTSIPPQGLMDFTPRFEAQQHHRMWQQQGQRHSTATHLHPGTSWQV